MAESQSRKPSTKSHLSLPQRSGGGQNLKPVASELVKAREYRQRLLLSVEELKILQVIESDGEAPTDGSKSAVLNTVGGGGILLL